MSYKDIEKRRAAKRVQAQRYREKNPEKARAACRGWYNRNLDKAREYERRRACAKYGITVEKFDELLVEQNNSCAICEKPFGDFYEGYAGPKIDHCHKTQKVRGLLCNRCNRAIGLFEDSAEFLARASEYCS